MASSSPRTCLLEALGYTVKWTFTTGRQDEPTERNLELNMVLCSSLGGASFSEKTWFDRGDAAGLVSFFEAHMLKMRMPDPVEHRTYVSQANTFYMKASYGLVTLPNGNPPTGGAFFDLTFMLSLGKPVDSPFNVFAGAQTQIRLTSVERFNAEIGSIFGLSRPD